MKKATLWDPTRILTDLLEKEQKRSFVKECQHEKDMNFYGSQSDHEL